MDAEAAAAVTQSELDAEMTLLREENAQLRRWFVDLLFWVAQTDELVVFARRLTERRFPSRRRVLHDEEMLELLRLPRPRPF